MKPVKAFKIRNYKLFTKFILSVLLTSGVSVIILTTLIFNWMSGKMLNDLKKINANELRTIGTAFTDHIDSTQHTAMSLYQNINIKNIMLSGDTSWSSCFYNAISQVKNVLTVDPVINSIYVMNPDGIVFKTANTTETDEAQEILFQMISGTDYPVGAPIFWHMPTLTEGLKPAITVFFRDGMSQSSTFGGAIAVNLDWHQLQKKLFSKYSNSISILNRRGNTIIQSSNAVSLDSDSLERILSSDLEADSFRTNSVSGDMLISCVTIDNGNYFIVSQSDYKSSIQELTHGRNMLFRICGSILLVIFVVSLFISYLIYLPVDHVIHHIRVLFQDSEPKDRKPNDLNILSNTLTSIADRMNSLEKMQEESTVNRLLTSSSQITSEQFFVDAQVLKQPHAPFILMLLRIHDSYIFSSRHSPDSHTFLVNSVCELAIRYFGNHLHCYACNPSKDCIALILSTEETDIETFDAAEAAADLQSMLRQVLELDVTIGSRKSGDVHMLNSLYSEIYKQTNSKMFFRNGTVFMENPAEADEIPVLSAKSEALTAKVKVLDSESFFELFSDLLFCCGKVHYDTALPFLFKLAVSILELSANVCGSSAQSLNHSAIYQELSDIHDYSQLTTYFHSLYEKCATAINEINNRQVRDIMEQALSFLNSNYSDPNLSTNIISDKLGISTGHFSRIFNEVTGCTFPDYLSHLRLEHAKDLLKNSSENVNKIAEAVGYGSASYFSASFKKEFGISPSKYRMQILSVPSTKQDADNADN